MHICMYLAICMIIIPAAIKAALQGASLPCPMYAKLSESFGVASKRGAAAMRRFSMRLAPLVHVYTCRFTNM